MTETVVLLVIMVVIAGINLWIVYSTGRDLKRINEEIAEFVKLCDASSQSSTSEADHSH